VDLSLQALTYRFSPPSLHDLGLVDALQWLVESMGAQHRLDVTLELVGPVVIADEWVRVILFRAVRELLTNVVRHSNGLSALLRVELRGGDVHITVIDHGSGFDTAAFDQHGYGLFGIREQCAYIGATFQILSSPGAGTTALLTTPCGARKDGPSV
jgi:signal transduction histidine kinase